MTQASLPMSYWYYSFTISNYTINRLPTSLLYNSSPFQIHHKNLAYDFFCIFGCSCFRFLHPYKQHKLQYRSKKCTFLSYSYHYKCYLCLDDLWVMSMSHVMSTSMNNLSLSFIILYILHLNLSHHLFPLPYLFFPSLLNLLHLLHL